MCLSVRQYVLKPDITHNSWHPDFLNSSLDPVRVVKCHATDWTQASVLGLQNLKSGFHTGSELSREESKKGSEDYMVPAEETHCLSRYGWEEAHLNAYSN